MAKLCQCGNVAYVSPKGQQHSRCSKCRSRHQLENRNPRKHRDYQLRRKFSVNADWYDAMFAAQEGVCAICKKANITGRALSVDHSHESGEARGLLCHNCNIGLGNFQDSPALLQMAIHYLRRYV